MLPLPSWSFFPLSSLNLLMQQWKSYRVHGSWLRPCYFAFTESHLRHCVNFTQTHLSCNSAWPSLVTLWLWLWNGIWLEKNKHQTPPSPHDKLQLRLTGSYYVPRSLCIICLVAVLLLVAELTWLKQHLVLWLHMESRVPFFRALLQQLP